MDTQNTQSGMNAQNKKTFSTSSDYESKNLSGAESGFQERIMRQINDLGEVLERAGNSISAKGWETIGNAIHKLGDTLEHLDIKIETKKANGRDRDEKPHELMSDDSDDVLSKPKDKATYAGASRTDRFDVKTPSSSSSSSIDSTFGSVGGSKTAESLQSKTTKPKASDSQAY